MFGFLSISGAFPAVGDVAAGGIPVGAEGGGDLADEADEVVKVGLDGSIGFDADGSLNVRFSTAACNLECTFINDIIYKLTRYTVRSQSEYLTRIESREPSSFAAFISSNTSRSELLWKERKQREIHKYVFQKNTPQEKTPKRHGCQNTIASEVNNTLIPSRSVLCWMSSVFPAI